MTSYQKTPKTIEPFTSRFALNEDTKIEINAGTPEFGFNGIGEVVFRRTYSRGGEDWAAVVIRVVQGVMSIRKEHYFRNSLRWDDDEMQPFAREMALSLFKMEWLPPGRGLWMMGTDFVYERGSMALNNCFKRSTTFWTDKGLRSFEDFEDGDQVIVMGKSKWMPATIKCFDEQELVELKVSNKEHVNTIYTTNNHRWLAKYDDDRFEIKATIELEQGFSLQNTDDLDMIDSDEYWIVNSVKPTGIIEKVWCVVEPEFEEFTLECGILTKNCSATDTKDDFVHSAEWTMDGLMNGVGVGFSTNWRGTAQKPDKSDSEVFIIPDSREGWVESLIRLMCAYIDSPRYGKNKFPVFDYSVIRGSGIPIKGFGGQSSGPDPLKKMHLRIEGYLDAFCDGFLRVDENTTKPYSHTRLVADVFNSIGACVVAGNVRRSAQISLGDVNDEDFVNLKNYTLNPERGEIGWMSNNSVMLKSDHGYNDFSYIPDMAARIRDNGEPGMINHYNMQKYGRYGKEQPDEATLVNPCFSGDTMIATADGRGAVSIKQLADEGKDIPVYSLDEVTKEVSIQWGRHPRVTGSNQKLIRIHFDGTNKDEFMDVTPNHKFLLNDGRVVEAIHLKKGDSLPQFKKGPNGIDDYVVVHSNGKRLVEHRMVAAFHDKQAFNQTYTEGIYNGCCKTNGVVVHHKDENKMNNHPDNLEITTASDHNRIHNQEYVGEGNPMYGKQHSDYTKRLIGDKCKVRCNDPEYRKKLSDAQTPETRELASTKMSDMRKRSITELYDRIEQENVGLALNRISPTELSVSRTCENEQCGLDFSVSWSKREQSYCCVSCSNTKRSSIEARKVGQNRTFEEKAKTNFHKQAMLYKDLINPDKKAFEAACKENNISCRFNANSENPWIASGWTQFKQMVDDYNHRVSYIEELDGEHTVYNITVDVNHTLAVVTKMNDDFSRLIGAFTYNCGEICLENFELCNLSEVFPTRCDDSDRFYEALRFATFYASTVSLLPTHRPETNAVIAKNRRIGVSISGIAQWASGEVPKDWGIMNYTNITRYLRKAYGIVKAENALLAKKAGVPASVRVTTIKPSGSISLLAGSTPGIHYPVSRYAIRRMRIGNDSPLVPALKEAGVPNEPDTYSDNTLVFEFAIDHGDVRPCEQVSPWEQFSLVAMMQRCYSDNCVSATVYFDKEKDGPDVEKLLAMFIPVLKSVSMLPHSGHGYAQAPYEPIDKEEYERRKNSYTIPDFNKVKDNVPVGSKFCSGDTCEL